MVGLRAALIEQGDPEIGQELIAVTHPDGTVEQLRLHEYERLYALPGVYEQIVSERLGCASPAKIASLLAAAVDGAGWARADVRVIDVAAGNGISGEALTAEGLHPVFGTDIVPAAREAALRDRPHLYDEYLTLDLLALTAEQSRRLRSLRANALTCVAPVGEDASQVPPAAFLEAVSALTDDALVSLHARPQPRRRRRRHRGAVAGAPGRRGDRAGARALPAPPDRQRRGVRDGRRRLAPAPLSGDQAQ